MKTLTQQYLEKNALVPVENKLLEAMQSLFGEGMVTHVFAAIPIYSDEKPERFEQRKANALVYWNFSGGEQLANDHSNLVVCLSNGKSIVIEHSESFCMRSLELDIFNIDFVSNPTHRIELTLPELLVAIAEEGCNKANSDLSLNEGVAAYAKYLAEMEVKINARSPTPKDGYLPASKVIGKGATGYVHPDYKKLVQNFARDLGISIYKE